MTYLDANVFIEAILGQLNSQEQAMRLIEAIEKYPKKFITSALTYDEVFWIIQKNMGKSAAIQACQLFIENNNLQVLDINRLVLFEASHLIEKYNLKPRDALHAATMILENEQEIISEDKDFDILPFKRFSIKEFVEKKLKK